MKNREVMEDRRRGGSPLPPNESSGYVHEKKPLVKICGTMGKKAFLAKVLKIHRLSCHHPSPEIPTQKRC
jgi:hypothetical protein